MEGDLLIDAQTSQVFFVFQSQLCIPTKRLACLSVSADAFKRIRSGESDLTLDAVWMFTRSAGIEEDLVLGGRADFRVRRDADLREGDLIENTTLDNKRWYIVEILFEGLTKIAPGMEVTGQTVTRTRLGAEPATLDPAWLRVLRSGDRRIVITAGQEVGVTAEVRVPGASDVEPGDFLFYAPRGLSLYVYQVIPEQSTLLCLCQQVQEFLPDEFDLTDVEGFWSQTLNGGTISVPGFGFLSLGLPQPSPARIGSGVRLLQTISGDFDVYALLAGFGPGGLGAGDEVAFGIIAYLDSTRYVAAAHYQTNSANGSVRIDFDGTSYDFDGSPGVSGNWLRLKRTGQLFYAYTASTFPTQESDWTELGATGDQFISAADVGVGLAGHRVDATAQTANIDYIRNWMAES